MEAKNEIWRRHAPVLGIDPDDDAGRARIARELDAAFKLEGLEAVQEAEDIVKDIVEFALRGNVVVAIGGVIHAFMLGYAIGKRAATQAGQDKR